MASVFRQGLDLLGHQGQRRSQEMADPAAVLQARPVMRSARARRWGQAAPLGQIRPGEGMVGVAAHADLAVGVHIDKKEQASGQS
jgi:hypothetical protein